MSYAFWSDTRTERLKELFSKGLSYSEIGWEIGGMTRGAISGKVNRLGLTRTSGQKARTHRKGPHRLTNLIWGDQTFKATQPQNNAPVNGFVSRNLTLFQLSDGLCKYATTDSLPHLFCGAPCNGSWCDYHAQLIWVHPPRRERRPYHE